jgi:hypothetical protein
MFSVTLADDLPVSLSATDAPTDERHVRVLVSLVVPIMALFLGIALRRVSSTRRETLTEGAVQGADFGPLETKLWLSSLVPAEQS